MKQPTAQSFKKSCLEWIQTVDESATIEDLDFHVATHSYWDTIVTVCYTLANVNTMHETYILLEESFKNQVISAYKESKCI